MARYFVKCILIEIWLIFLSWLDWVFGKKTTEIKCHFYHISKVYTVNMTYHCWAWVSLPEQRQCSLGSSTVKLLFLLLSIPSSLEGGHYVQFTLESGIILQSFAAAAAKSLQSCLTLWDPIDGSPPGSPVTGILQARTLEWVAIFFSNAWKWKVKVKVLSRVRLLATPWTAAYQAPPSMGFSKQEYWSGVPLPSPSLL